jgi:hypothetical protein
MVLPALYTRVGSYIDTVIGGDESGGRLVPAGSNLHGI